ncbi:hypothetical protein MesoLjLc_50660 [Mesorhizobium sp. L-8-10]|uniref:hypothetical protein n=1 Tax=Mesorhizobium sp. L-8-10 TaxID=2744523 RepID=UPI001937359F|nr:hypothetical protein [Mesorhizobium sp. L-8-10]BCH33136.1 hypothetical protein MesoLjLc_50660 [Mesorhizobium sp. L-8-10]
MGGKGSGGHNRLTDTEKKRRGTFRAAESEAVFNARAAEKIITGVFLPRVPDPSLPLNEIGKAKYVEFATLLLESGKLTKIVAEDCERYAVMHQQMHAKLEAGKMVPQQLLNAMDSLSRRLKIAEDAPPIANPNEKKRFNGVGFSNNRASPIRLRPHRPTGTGEL